MSRSRRPDPDGTAVLEADRGTGTGLASAHALLVRGEEYEQRAATRAGARDLDAAVERMPGLSRARMDRERAMPRDHTPAAGNPLTIRTLPEPDAVRGPLSARQRRVRSAAKRSAQDAMPGTEYQALSRLVTDGQYRDRLNDALSDAAGDVQELADRDRVAIQRIDRAIGRYEADSTRGHVVYANLEMPPQIPAGHTVRTLREYFQPGAVVSFDRMIGGAHQLHEIDPGGAEGPGPAFEIQTRRGIYLGRSDSLDDTTHLLPRGLRTEVVSVHEASYRRPDGSRGRRPVIQIRDLDA